MPFRRPRTHAFPRCFVRIPSIWTSPPRIRTGSGINSITPCRHWPAPRRLKIAYQAPCSLQHGLRQSGFGEAQLRAAGFEVIEIPEGHLCCGSAGSYSILQTEIANALRARKLDNIATLDVNAVASPNIGCLMHLTGPDAPPVVHPAELIDWAEGGPLPAALTRPD